MSDARFEGDLSQRPLADVLGEIYRNNLKGRLSLHPTGAPPLELHVEDRRVSSPSGDPEAEVRRAVALGLGRFILEPGPALGAQASSLLKLIFAAARAIPAVEQVRVALGNLDAPLQITESGRSSLNEGMSISAQEGFLLSRVNGVASANQICQVSPSDEEETLRSIFGLTSAGLLQIGTLGEQAAAVAPQRQSREDPMAKLQGFLKKTEASTPLKPEPAPATPAKGRALSVSEPAARPKSPKAATSKRQPETAEPSSERMTLLNRLRASETQNFYQLLEVETGTTDEMIQKKYYSLARRYHPDRFHSPDVADLQPAMEKLFARVNQAFHTLKDAETRQEYDRSLYKGERDTRKVQQAAAAEVARENYRRGRDLVAQTQYIKALPYLENAVRADETKAEYFEMLGMVQSLNPRLKLEAEETLKKACELSPARAAGFLRLGLHYFKTRQFEKATKELQEAVGWDPTDPLARMALGKAKAGGANAVKDGTWLIRKLLEDS